MAEKVPGNIFDGVVAFLGSIVVAIEGVGCASFSGRALQD